jgi:gliding motility-associated protein GldM
MGLPKEPRQKMINMMYLVLTALLALNVSAEILNAFKTVNNSITKANDVLASNNDEIYKQIDAKKADPKSQKNALIWAPLAVKAHEYSKSVYDTLESLKLRLKREAGYAPEKGDTLFHEDNLDAATRLFDNQGQGKRLYAMMTDYKKNILDIDPEIGKVFANKLPINLEIPKSQSGNAKLDFTTAYFHMTPAIAALTILSKFQNDVKNSENQVVSYCNSKIDAVVVHFDNFGFVGGLSSSYVMPGEKISVMAGLGATSSGAAPTFFINGREVKAGGDGIATEDFNAGGAGAGQKVHVTVKYKDQDGIDKTIDKDLPYTVGQPAGVAVMADKMNVLYIGVDNPLTITAGVGAEKISASFTGGTVSRVNGNHWVAKPTSPGEHNVNVIIEGKSTPIKFRVKYLPNPASFVGTSKGGSISSATFKAMGGVIAKYEETDFEAAFKVVSYTLAAQGGAFPNYTEAQNDGNRWVGRAGDIVGKAGPGTNIFLDKIIVVGPDGRRRELAPMMFNLK